MIFAGSDSEMISKLAKSIAHFFVVQNITEESKEVIYAYGMELLISDVLNTIIVLLIALFSHTLPAVVVFIAVFMGLRQFVGGFHANSHLSCMFTLVMVMMVFSYGICNVSGHITPIFSISFIMIALPIILCIAPVPHPNKPMSEEKSVKLRKRSCILAVTLSVVTIALLVFQYRKISLYKENLEYHCDWLAVDNQYLGNTSVCEFVNDDYGNTSAKIKFNTDVELQPNKQFVIHFRLNAADWSNWDTSNDYSMGTEQLLPNDKIIVFYNEQLISGIQS